ncbi:MAG: hypothetical protein AAGU74_13965 [Bacillota bacterium]
MLFLQQHGARFADRKRYYDCFDSYYGEKTAKPMVTMVAEYLEERLRQYLDILK